MRLCRLRLGDRLRLKQVSDNTEASAEAGAGAESKTQAGPSLWSHGMGACLQHVMGSKLTRYPYISIQIACRV